MKDRTDRSWIPATLLQPGTKWRKKFIWDGDEVTFAFRDSLMAYIEKHRQIILPPESAFYDFSLDPNSNYSNTEFQRDLVAFARLSKGGYDARALRPGIKKAMKYLDKKGIVNCLWSAAPGTNDHISWLGRKYWTASPQEATFTLIADYRLPIEARNVKFLAAHEKASEMAEGHYPAIADDYQVTIVEVAARGLLGFLVDQPYNRGLVIPNAMRANDPIAIARSVAALFDELEKRDLIA